VKSNSSSYDKGFKERTALSREVRFWERKRIGLGTIFQVTRVWCRAEGKSALKGLGVIAQRVELTQA
jgi:hypothetical protein